MKKKSGLATVIGIIAILLITFYSLEIEPEEDTSTYIPVELVKTIDGDTIKIIYEGKEQNVRYLLVDTPETNHPQLGKQPFGERATERNRELMNSGKLEIEFDIGERVDKYGRLPPIFTSTVKVFKRNWLKKGLRVLGTFIHEYTSRMPLKKRRKERKAVLAFGHWKITWQIVGLKEVQKAN